MKIHQAIQKKFEILGIGLNQSRFNGKVMGTYLIYVIGITFSAMFLICEANNFQEYTDNLYITTALAGGFFSFTNMILKMNQLFTLIDNIEKTLGKSEYNI